MFRVIIIEDCHIMASILKNIINSIAGFEVIDIAENPYIAREQIKSQKPDLVTIDCDMPKMDGLTFLKNLTRLYPMPAIMIAECVDIRNISFQNGALDFILKPDRESIDKGFKEEVIQSILTHKKKIHQYHLSKITPEEKALKRAKLSLNVNKLVVEPRYKPDDILLSKPSKIKGNKVVAIGSSTGGVEALMKIFETLNEDLAPILITQHIPTGFAESFAIRLNSISKQNVKTAEDGDILYNGCTYMAPGDKHLMLGKNDNDEYIAIVKDGVKVSRHKPSVDVLYRSMNNIAGSGSIAIILTGMGDDGTIGMKELFDNNAYTIGQSEKSCVVYGMPKQAFLNNAIKEVVDLDNMANKINSICKY